MVEIHLWATDRDTGEDFYLSREVDEDDIENQVAVHIEKASRDYEISGWGYAGWI